jgi:hypothetical protein
MVGFLASSGLFDLLKTQQQLILGKRFGSTAKTVALQFLDDLFEPLGAGALRQQHRLQRAGIVGKRICRNRHDAITSCVAPRRELLHRGDSLCRNHPGCNGAGVSRAA